MGQFEDRKDYAKGRLIGNIDEAFSTVVRVA